MTLDTAGRTARATGLAVWAPHLIADGGRHQVLPGIPGSDPLPHFRSGHMVELAIQFQPADGVSEAGRRGVLTAARGHQQAEFLDHFLDLPWYAVVPLNDALRGVAAA